MTFSHLLSFVCGGLVVLGLTSVTPTQAETPGHVYELRMYHVKEGKMDAVEASFRDHVSSVFKRLNMKSVGYWVPQDAPASGTLFIYLMEHPSRQEGDKNWAAFNKDPEWQKERAAVWANSALTSSVDRYYMNPTDFSPLK